MIQKIKRRDFSYKEEKIKVRDKLIQTYSFGKGDKYILALPSFPHLGIYYRWLFSHFDLRDFTFIVFDTPGWIGNSDDYGKDEKFYIQDVVDISKEVVNHYTTGELRILGYSFGVLIAILLAAEWKDRIHSVVFVSGVVATNKLGMTNKYVFQTSIAKTFHLGGIVKKKIINEFNHYAKVLSSVGLNKDFINKYKEMIKQSDERILLDSIYEIFHSDWSKYLDKIKDKQVLLVNSLDEHKTFSHQAKLMRKILK